MQFSTINAIDAHVRTVCPTPFLPFANAHPQVRLLLAHLGNGAGDHSRVDLQVRAVQAARHGNVWVDTSSARSILPNLVEWAAKEIGRTASSSARILRFITQGCSGPGSKPQRSRTTPSGLSCTKMRCIFFGLNDDRLNALR